MGHDDLVPSDVSDTNAVYSGISSKEAEENLNDFFDTLNNGPKSQERRRIKNLKRQGMLLQENNMVNMRGFLKDYFNRGES